jgi:hypothetical protein
MLKLFDKLKVAAQCSRDAVLNESRLKRVLLERFVA